MPDYSKLHDLVSHRVELEYDNGSITHINPLHITKLEWRKPAA